MSSEISTETQSKLRAASTAETAGESTFHPWQFFLLAGMLAATASVIVATGQSAPSIVLLSVTVVAASLVGLGFYLALVPLVSPEKVQTPSLIGGRTRAALEREKSLVLRSIKELEFDHAMGKVAQSDFDEMSGRLRSRAIGLMRQLDSSGGYRDQIEKELQARLGAGVPAPAAPAAVASADVSDVDGDESRPIAVSACAACGTPNDADARFCKNCGTKLSGAA